MILEDVTSVFDEEAIAYEKRDFKILHVTKILKSLFS